MSDEKNKNYIPELLIPAGSLEVLKTAVYYGADAIYIGGDVFSLRAKAKNFDDADMKEGIEYAHSFGKKVYVTANILAHNEDLKEAEAYFTKMKDLRPDGLIMADPGMIMIAKEICPDVPIHLSTQANNTNYATFKFWYDQGIKRVVTARELSLKEISEIRKNIPDDMEIESFVHGAMCISYSGRCLLSNYFTGRDANHGECTHPCRWKYSVMEEKRPGEYLPVYENERGTFIFNSKDLNMVGHIPELAEAGINSLKVEGRMKTALYVASITRAYRMALDAYALGMDEYEKILPRCEEEIKKCTYRQFTTGFYFGKPSEESQIYDNNTYDSDAVYLGRVEAVTKTDEGSRIEITQKNKFAKGEVIDIMKPDGMDLKAAVLYIHDEEGNEMESAPHSKQKLFVSIDKKADVNDILRTESRRMQ